MKAALGIIILLFFELIHPFLGFADPLAGPMDNPAILLSIGGRYYRDRNHFELSLTEDLNTSGAPDFIINFSFKRTF